MDKLLDFLSRLWPLRSRDLASLAIGSVLIIILPETFLGQEINFSSILGMLKPWALVVSLFSAPLVTIDFAHWIISLYTKRERLKQRVERLNHLTGEEVKILYSCLNTNEQSVVLHFAHSGAQGLCTKELLVKSGGAGDAAA